ncbi:hypothetical protein [Nitrosomonas communis]|uniref:Uncharacterized protein n=1 Tax=Nitrosomonas communis TaxID=44574 RepID=A0A1I4WJU5_9PROT|nr:hypothetical protein [Nitrosomonas communis]SFN13978.1 hypothetical protein SAMN05421863_11124 [Nitrosomonas communis]
MNDKAISFAYIAAIIGGAVLWQATAASSGKIEAWDAPSFGLLRIPFDYIVRMARLLVS